MSDFFVSISKILKCFTFQKCFKCVIICSYLYCWSHQNVEIKNNLLLKKKKKVTEKNFRNLCVKFSFEWWRWKQKNFGLPVFYSILMHSFFELFQILNKLNFFIAFNWNFVEIQKYFVTCFQFFLLLHLTFDSPLRWRNSKFHETAEKENQILDNFFFYALKLFYVLVICICFFMQFQK